MTKTLLIAFFASRLAAATLEVRVYDLAATPASDLREAEKVLERILRSSGIELRWTAGAPESIEARKVMFVDPPPKGREREFECSARRDIALTILPDSAPGVSAMALGYANPLAPEGINATVFHRRVVDRAREHGVAIGLLLGHAIAHEIGHVLFRSAAHRKHGIMAGGWDGNQFRWMRSAGMFFERSESRRMQASITGEGCSAVSLSVQAR